MNKIHLKTPHTSGGTRESAASVLQLFHTRCVKVQSLKFSDAVKWRTTSGHIAELKNREASKQTKTKQLNCVYL